MAKYPAANEGADVGLPATNSLMYVLMVVSLMVTSGTDGRESALTATSEWLYHLNRIQLTTSFFPEVFWHQVCLFLSVLIMSDGVDII